MIGEKHTGVTEEVLDSLGKRWEKKDGQVRWYVNDWEDIIGLEVLYYNTGNISAVYYDNGNDWHGEGHPSNRWYARYVSGTKVWIDADGAVHVDYCKDAKVEKDIIAKVGAKISEAQGVA
jgi:hypothetical protein